MKGENTTLTTCFAPDVGQTIIITQKERNKTMFFFNLRRWSLASGWFVMNATTETITRRLFKTLDRRLAGRWAKIINL